MTKHRHGRGGRTTPKGTTPQEPTRPRGFPSTTDPVTQLVMEGGNELLQLDMRTPLWCRRRVQELGPDVAALAEDLMAINALHRLRSCQGVIGLADKHTAQRLNAACRRALEVGDPTYRTVKGILAAGTETHLSGMLDTLDVRLSQAQGGKLGHLESSKCSAKTRSPAATRPLSLAVSAKPVSSSSRRGRGGGLRNSRIRSSNCIAKERSERRLPGGRAGAVQRAGDGASCIDTGVVPR